MLFKNTVACLWLLLLYGAVNAQTTTGGLNGMVKTVEGKALPSATITALHQPTGTVYRAQTNSRGRYQMDNVNPGGPYQVQVSFINYTTEKKEEIYISLGEAYSLDFELKPQANQLDSVHLKTFKNNPYSGKGGAETWIGRDKMDNLPTVGRNLYDYLRLVPQAKLTGQNLAEGISIAGQNNRYNSFYVDGAVNNDVFGLSTSGTNGGQAGIAPLSVDAIDQFQVVISPYDASLGNFTGGGINAITRSGTNQFKGSVYYIFRNQDMAGKTPDGPQKDAVKLSDFSNQTIGFRMGGPIKKNKVFYFLNAELQRDQAPQPFNFNQYTGNTKSLATINSLADYLRSQYHYEPGGFLDNKQKTNANRIAAKLDWNIGNKNKITLSYRYTKAERTLAFASSNTTINFFNNGYFFPGTTHSFSAELKSVAGKRASNKLLFTFTHVTDDRNILGSPFPNITIFDGSGTIFLGSDASSTQNLLLQKNFSLQDAFKFTGGKHTITLGTDNELNHADNVFIQRSFGAYRYDSLTQFLQNERPNQYRVGYPLTDNKLNDQTTAAARFTTFKLALFVNDEIRLSQNFTLNLGLRADYYRFITKPMADAFAADSALPAFEQYYDVKGARPGQQPNIPVSLSPRLGFSYKIKEEGVVIRGGISLFTGRIPLVWPGGIYNYTGITQAGFTVDKSNNAFAWNSIRFRPDAYKQYKPAELGIPETKGDLNLISKQFSMPKLLRTSLAFDKQFNYGWSGTLEGILSRNINEVAYTNLNILPPSQLSNGVGQRNVYDIPLSVPINADGSNPYTNAILLSNTTGSKGFAYNFTLTVNKVTINGWLFNVNFNYGDSYVFNEATSSVNTSQWQNMETVNGNNFVTRSRSDFSAGQRIFGYVAKKFLYAKKKMATTVSLVYSGQSGQPFSYVYSGAPVRDGVSGNNLIYVPLKEEIQNMLFLPNTITGVGTFSPADQMSALDSYIDHDHYLKNRRGNFAQRNAGRLPFTNIMDIRIMQDFNIKIKNKRYQFQLAYNVFNVTNLINRNWGRQYFLDNDQFSLLSFVGYTSPGLTPQYQFNPTIQKPWSISPSSLPAYSARWTSQLELRFNIN